MERLHSSFRDDAGFLLTHGGRLYRVVTQAGKADFELFLSSGLYDKLASEGKIVPHEVITDFPFGPGYHKVLAPQKIPFVSYPYEWSFSQLKDGALLTLDCHEQALRHGLSLKDASFFNIQFIGPRPVFIDTLSFEKRQDRPWVAYKQFCEHFLGPLLLMSTRSHAVNHGLIAFLDGIPLALATKLIPLTSRLKWGPLLHLSLHAHSQKKHENGCRHDPRANLDSMTFGIKKQLALVESLRSTILQIMPGCEKTEWTGYTEESAHYSDKAKIFKSHFVEEKIQESQASLLWDLGGNTGDYSRLATQKNIYTICFDKDPLCVEKNYQLSKQRKDRFMLPLVMDLANPSPSIGWAHRERMSLLERGPADLCLVLALIHHLRISANIPLVDIAEFLSRCGERLIIEFIPKSDPMIQKLLRSRKDIFNDYSQEEFENSLTKKYGKFSKSETPDNGRTLYYFKR